MKILFSLAVLATSIFAINASAMNEFTVVIRCESTNSKADHCIYPTIHRVRRVQLLQQFSDAPCIQGETFGRMNNGVWVSDGCYGEFKLYVRPTIHD